MHQRLYARVRAVNIWLMAPLLGLAVFLSVFVATSAPVAQAAASSNLNFQARLLTSSGAVVPDGTYNIDFKLYTADSTTGSVGTCTGACVWEETRKNSNSQGVTVINGYFSVNLGSVTAFPNTINWDQQLWLTMNIGGTTTGASPTWDGEMQNAGHSILLTALPFAFAANKLTAGTGSSRGTLSFASLGQATDVTLPDPGAATATVCYQNASACGFAPGTAANYIQNGTSLQTNANFNIQSAATNSIGAIVQGASGQTADIFELKNGSIVFSVGNNGQTLFKPTSGNDSTTFFQIQPAGSSTPLFDVDTVNSRIGIGATPSAAAVAATLQVAGTGSIQQTSVAGTVTASGNEITDTVRAAKTQGDGRAAPDSSYGIWEGSTNQISNGGAESNATGWSGSVGGETISRDTTKAVFGSASVKVVTPGGVVAEGTNSPMSNSGTAATGQTWTASAWVWAPSGATMSLQIIERDAGGSLLASSSTAFTGNNAWQKVTVTRTFNNASTSRAALKVVTATSAQGLSFWVDGAQVEQKPTATPYIETNGATASRSASRVQGSSSKLSSSQGWVSARLRYGFSSTSTSAMIAANGGTSLRVMQWQLDANNRILFILNNANQYQLIRVSGGSGASISSGTQTFNAGDTANVTAAWNGSNVFLWINGTAATPVANAVAPSGMPATFDIGTSGGTTAFIDSDILWFATGTGTISNSDATAISNLGNADPDTTFFTGVDTASVPTMVWKANSSAYQDKLAFSVQDSTTAGILNVDAADASVLLPNATSSSSALIIGKDTNLYRKSSQTLKTDSNFSVGQNLTVNGSVLFQNNADSATAFQVQTANGLSVASADTSGGQFLLGTAGTNGLNGKLVFNTINASNTKITIQAASTASSYSLTLPTTGPSLGQCLQNDGTTVGQLTFGPCGASGTFVNFAPSSVQTDSSTNNSIFINKTGASGNLLELQKNGADAFNVDNNGNVSFSGTLNTNTFTSTSLTFAGAGSASIQSASSQALNITGNASSLWQVGGTNQNLTIQTSGTGTLALDTVGLGIVNLGAANAGTINIGNANSTSISIGSTSLVGTVTNKVQGLTTTLTGAASNSSYVVKSTSNSNGTFQVQNSSNNKVFSVDTSAGQTILGQSSSVNGSLLFQNSSNSNGITLNSTGANASYTLTLPGQAPSGGLCIQTSTGNASQLVFASCANNNTSISEVAYWDSNNSTTLPISPSAVGDEIVLTTQIPSSGVSVNNNGVSGGGVTNWSRVTTSAGNGTVNRVEMWVGTVSTVGNSTITVTYSASPGANEITATEFTAAGVNQSTSWGVESFNSQLNSTASGTVTYPSLTAVNGAELYVGYAQAQNPPVSSGSTTGFNYQQTSTQHNMITYNPSLTANTTYQPTASQSPNGQSNTVAAILTAFVTSTAINNSTSLQKANFYVQAANAGSVAGVLQAASSGSGDILNLRNSGGTNVVTVSSSGDVAIKSTGSTTAFQVQNSSGYNVLGVDTTGNQVTLGDATHLSGKITFRDSGDSNTISITAPTSIATNYTLALPTNAPTAGLCLATSPSNANQLVFSSCATQVSAATISYVNKWDSHTGGPPYTIADSPTSIGNLLVLYSHVSGGATVTGVSGGGVASGGWSKVTAYTGAGTPGNIEMWRGVVATTGSGTITVSYTGTVGTYEIAAQEFSMGSANGTWAIDTSGTATSTSSVTTVNYPTLTPLNSNELYAGYAYGGGVMSGTCGTSSGFTYTSTGAVKCLIYDTSVTGGTPYTPTATQTSGVYASIAALIEAYVGTSVIVNTTATQQANFNVQAATSGTVAGVLQGASSGSADVLQVKDGAGINVMTVNTSNVNGVDGVTLGASNSVSGQLTFNSSGNSNSITIAAPSAPGASYTLTLPTTTPAPGQCLATSPSNANQLVFSSCANQVTSVAITFVNNWKASQVTLSPSLPVSPANLGDLITLEIFASKGNTISNVAGGGVSAWSRIVTTGSFEMWRGQVTATGSVPNITASLSTPSGPTVEIAAQEWTTGSNNGSWVVDTSGSISNSSSTTVTYPSLTPQSSKDLYVGYAIGGSTMSAGSTPGFSYLTGGATSNMGTYNTTVSATTQPTATQSSAGTSNAIGALIAAYSSSSVIANSTNTQQANFNIQAATPGSVAGTLQAFFTGTGDIFDLLDGSGTTVGSVDYQGNMLVRPSTAGATAFQVQNTSNVNVLSVDTSAKQVVIGAGSTGESSVSLLVLDNRTGTSADPSGVNGAMYYNATTHNFRCYAAGGWQNCGGLLSSNTSQSTANNNCSNNCAAFSTFAAVPANYCQAGRVIRLNAHGYFSSQASATNLQFGVYYGTDNSVAANDTLIGTLTPTVSVTSASNNYFGLDFDVTCFSTTSMQADGLANIQVGAAASGVTGVPISSTSATTVVSTSAKNLYIFPIWGAASTSNTAKITQFIVTSP